MMAPADDNGPTVGSSEQANNGASRSSSTNIDTSCVPNPVLGNPLQGGMVMAPTDDNRPTMLILLSKLKALPATTCHGARRQSTSNEMLTSDSGH